MKPQTIEIPVKLKVTVEPEEQWCVIGRASWAIPAAFGPYDEEEANAIASRMKKAHPENMYDVVQIRKAQ